MSITVPFEAKLISTHLRNRNDAKRFQVVQEKETVITIRDEETKKEKVIDKKLLLTCYELIQW